MNIPGLKDVVIEKIEEVGERHTVRVCLERKSTATPYGTKIQRITGFSHSI